MRIAKKTFSDAGTFLDTAVGRTGAQQDSIGTVIANIIQGAFGVTGVVFLALTVYAGLTWMSARGNEEQIAKSRRTLVAAIIGLVITVSAYAITALVSGQFVS